MKKYGDGVQILLKSSSYKIYQLYQYSDSILKHLPEKSLKCIEKLLLFGKKKASDNGNIDRRANNSNTLANITDAKLTDRIDKFADVINSEKVYRIPLRYFWNLGRINYSVKINFKIKCNLETVMSKPF